MSAPFAVDQVQAESAANSRDTSRPKPWINAVRISTSAVAYLVADIKGWHWAEPAKDLHDTCIASFHPTKAGPAEDGRRRARHAAQMT